MLLSSPHEKSLGHFRALGAFIRDLGSSSWRLNPLSPSSAARVGLPDEAHGGALSSAGPELKDQMNHKKQEPYTMDYENPYKLHGPQVLLRGLEALPAAVA